MTYLQLINRVLRKLREGQSSSISGEKALFYGQLVNEVKTDLENAGPWFALRTPLTGSLTPGSPDLDLTASTDEYSYLLYQETNAPQAFITTADRQRRLSVISWSAMDALHTLQPDADEDQPACVAFRNNGTGLVAKFFPTPDSAYTYRLECVVNQAELTDPDTVITIPAAPVWREAVVRAMEERGEEFSGSLEAERARAKEALFQAILADWGSEERTFEVV